MSDCNICCMKITKTRYLISCSNCQEEVCSKCCEKYILDSHDDPSCMYCHNIWNKQFLIDNFTKTFVNTKYKKTRQQILYDRERALFPQSLEVIAQQKRFIEARKEKDKLMQEQYNIYREKISLKNQNASDNISMKSKRVIIKSEKKKLRNLKKDDDIQFCTKWIFFNENENKKLKEKIAQRKTKIEAIKQETAELEMKIEIQRTIIYDNTTGNRRQMERYKFNFNCPTEDCKGLLNDDFHCILCSKDSCKKCYTSMENEEHECNNDDIETFKMLKNKTKPCPNCNTLIYKIEGCNQIFCTHCKTPFSWTTGRIITNEFFHNPHYFDYINNGGDRDEVFRHQGNQPVVQTCVGEPLNYGQFRWRIDNISTCRDITEKISDYFRHSAHLRHVELPKVDYNENISYEINRIKFLTNVITEKKFRSNLTTYEKKKEKYILYSDLITVYHQTLERIFREAYDDRSTNYIEADKCEKIVEQCEQITNFVDNCLDKICKDYNCVKPKWVNKNH